MSTWLFCEFKLLVFNNSITLQTYYKYLGLKYKNTFSV